MTSDEWTELLNLYERLETKSKDLISRAEALKVKNPAFKSELFEALRLAREALGINTSLQLLQIFLQRHKPTTMITAEVPLATTQEQ